MKIILMQTGKTTDKNISLIADLYSSRISKYYSFETITLPDLKNTKNMPVEEQRIKEGRKIVQSLTGEDLVILLDEKGREFTTLELASWFEKQFMISRKRIVFIIGGAWGFSEEVYSRADMKISLSRMTFPHQLVRLLFLEQIYRVFTIIKGEPYHHD